jgi:ATP-binding protein involved in chromosome partitioning
LVSNIEISGNNVNFSVQMKNAAMHARKRMEEACAFALERHIGKEISVNVNIQALKKAEAAQNILPNIKNTIAIVSGKGGVGKSTIASNTAVGLAKKGFKVGIVDADIYGPSVPLMFDVLHYKPLSRKINNKQYIVPAENYGVKILSIGFFAELDQAVVWRGPMAVKALNQLLFDALWGELDYLIIDSPPGTGDIHLSIVQALPLTGAIIVSTPQNIALADARKAIGMFKLDNINVPILGIVENMSWFSPVELPDNKYYIFGKEGAKHLAETANIPLLGEIPLVLGIRESGDAGRPAVMQDGTTSNKAFMLMCDNIIERVNWRKKNLNPTKIVEVDYTKANCS